MKNCAPSASPTDKPSKLSYASSNRVGSYTTNLITADHA